MAKKAVQIDLSKRLVDDQGLATVPTRAFLRRIQKTPATALPDLTGTPTTAQLRDRLNALAQILRDNDLLDD